MKALVTGAAGYIGSCMVAALIEQGHHVVAVDRAPKPAWWPFENTQYWEEDLISFQFPDLFGFFRGNSFDTCFHFAGLTSVSEAEKDPTSYYWTNTLATLRLANLWQSTHRGKPFIFSSTAAVYGAPDEQNASRYAMTHHRFVESDRCHPTNAYGRSKLAAEFALDDLGRAHGLRWAALRYFNAAGAWQRPDGTWLGERHAPETHLLPLLLQAFEEAKTGVAGTPAMWLNVELPPSFILHGDSWPTADGTCIRDYIHIRDLCAAHLATYEWLKRADETTSTFPIFNLGTGSGTSVGEAIRTVGEVLRGVGTEVSFTIGPPRAGDVARLVADASKAEKFLGWGAKRGFRACVNDAIAFAKQEI